MTTKEQLAKMQLQRDQVLHLLSGGTLTEEQVTGSGLGVGVLIEQRHHEYMRCKAEKERDAALAACASMRRWITECKCSTQAARDHALSTDCGTGYVPVTELENALNVLRRCKYELETSYWPNNEVEREIRRLEVLKGKA